MTEPCPLCDRRWPSVADLVRHVDRAHPDGSVTPTTTTSPPPPRPADRADWACEQCTLINDGRAVACRACNATAPAVLRELQQASPAAARAAKRPWPGDCSEPDGPSAATPVGVAATAEALPQPQPQLQTTVSALARLVRAANLAVPGSSWALCAATTEHVASEAPDRTYGCGYRNLQMVLTSLREPDGRWPPHLADKLGPAGSLPTIRQLQVWLEQAWAEGANLFDQSHFFIFFFFLGEGAQRWLIRCGPIDGDGGRRRLRPTGRGAAERPRRWDAQVDRRDGGGRRAPVAGLAVRAAACAPGSLEATRT